MILDSEGQREVLVKVLNGVSFQGNYETMKNTINEIGAILDAIKTAKIEAE
jgi:hypothetical protein